LRQSRQITQKKLSEDLYISVQTINKWENGKSLPDVANLLKLAKYYNISLDTLMNNTSPCEKCRFKLKKKYTNFSKRRRPISKVLIFISSFLNKMN
ncbi:TPA_asm: helix-turn-helix domain-containing protein, partial [Listeria monocytogenes]|nr:helix-turn-helix domain-containing protein [Listeria monocytogenes]